MNIRERFKYIAAEECENLGFILVDAQVKGDKKRPLLVVYADNEEGITLDECETLSRHIQDVIDMDDEFAQNYRLDVSSPGTDRPLTEPFQFRRNIGKNVNIRFWENEKQKETNGKLVNFTDATLIIEKGGKELEINRKGIIQVKIKLQW